MTSVWEPAWEAVNEVFCQVAVVLRACNSDLWWECGHRESDAFPFSAYASFSTRGLAGEEDVVISLSFNRVDGLLAFTSDLSRGDGELLAEGPSGEKELATDVGKLRDWIASVIDEALSFVRDSTDLLRRELC